VTDTPRPPSIIEVDDSFWNIRGSFRIGGILDIGTQASLVRRASGKFVFLDACALKDDARAWIAAKTNGGADIEAILHLHPFHTVYAKAHHQLYPGARLYGTARHVEALPDLPWQDLRTEDSALHELFAGDLEFSIPRGVDFISKNPKLHFSSVLAFHPASKTLHVDDTVLYIKLPPVIRLFKKDTTRFHMTLARVLQRREGAAEEFREWAGELIERCRDVDNLCAAHSAALLGRHNQGASIAERLEGALAAVDKKLTAHARRHG
jgi:hypothetical protein